MGRFVLPSLEFDMLSIKEKNKYWLFVVIALVIAIIFHKHSVVLWAGLTTIIFSLSSIICKRKKILISLILSIILGCIIFPLSCNNKEHGQVENPIPIVLPKCSLCHGSKHITCHNCNGRGYVLCDKCNGKGRIKRKLWFGSKPCPSCYETGRLTCYFCKGNGNRPCPKCR